MDLFAPGVIGQADLTAETVDAPTERGPVDPMTPCGVRPFGMITVHGKNVPTDELDDLDRALRAVPELGEIQTERTVLLTEGVTWEVIEVILRDVGPTVAALAAPVVSQWAKKWFKRGCPDAQKIIKILGPDGKPLQRLSSDDEDDG